MIEQLLAEDEDAKVRIYVALQRALLAGATLDRGTRRHIVRAVGELTADAVLRVLPEIQRIDARIHDGNTPPGIENRLHRIRTYTDESGPLVRAAVQVLERWGLVLREPFFAGIVGGTATRITPLGEFLIKITAELRP